MVVLDDYQIKIEDFVRASFGKFRSAHAQPNSIGIYCCPWSGWITTNFNVTKTLRETANNCPDFEFVEYDILELPEWQSEYEADAPSFSLSGKVWKHNHDRGDEVFNAYVFDFLLSTIMRLRNEPGPEILLQMLDSRHVRLL